MSRRMDGRRLSWVRLLLVVGLLAALVLVGMSSWTSNRDAARAAESGQWFGSYVDATSTPFYPLAENIGEGQRVVLAFAVADPKEPCRPSWGGYYTMDQANETFDLDRQIARLKEQGGSVVVSTGGLLNDELATACKDVPKIVEGYEQLLERYDSTVLDLDVEGDDLEDVDSGARRADAVASVQEHAAKAGKPVQVWVTLPVDTRGLTASGLSEVQRLLDGGVDLTGVNLMTMNFGETRAAGQSMADASEQAANSTHAQLKELYRQMGLDIGDQTLWSKIGLTPMIGQNDLLGEVFTLDDAAALNSFAVANRVGRVSMWSANRDQDCGPNNPDPQRVSNNCSGTPQQDGSFAVALSANLDATKVIALPDPSPMPAPVETAIVDDPAKSPYPIWNVQAAYPKAERIVWRGNVYEAKWWTQGDAPDAPVAEAASTPWLLIGPVLPGDKPAALPAIPKGLYPAWSPTIVYQKADRVVLEGRIFEAKWWTQANSPQAALQGAPDSPWVQLTDAQVRLLVDQAEEKASSSK
ncbi:chitinase [Paeniglutamicibacter cryotolerans]|uniref:Chitinase n=1 Tax=Paeniglutamicibacter cryotolerans TaxID=670079 RepID=A0A839QEQ1_9MICC|nr:carbohydrate-binding protein [Paeniglutamicibacter cryotolerans]MBB2994107.1 chitinase [Paeniglutamicibacter cryotolerans]